MTSETPWYTDGLRFECSQCGDCCTGAPGFVWVSQAEIDAIAEEVGMASEQFEDTYVRKIGARRLYGSFPMVTVFFLTRKIKVARFMELDLFSAEPGRFGTLI